MKGHTEDDPVITLLGKGRVTILHRDRRSDAENRGADNVEGQVRKFLAPAEGGLDLGLEDAVRLRWAWTSVECGGWVHWKLRLRGGSAR